MNQNNLFLIEGLKLQQGNKQAVQLIPQVNGLKMINTLDNSLILNIDFYDDGIFFDWSPYINNKNDENIYFIIHFHGQLYKVFGTPFQLDSMYEFSSGKFIFKRNDIYILDTINESISTHQLSTIINRHNGKKYIEKRINQLDSQEISNQSITDFGWDKVPEEIRIIQLLNIQRCPYIMKIDQLAFDGECYSIIYQCSTQISLRQILKKYKNPPISFIIEVMEQLLLVLNIFEELNIIHNGITLDNICYSQEFNSIYLCNFSHSIFETQNRSLIKGNSIGFVPPEQYQLNSRISTQANIYQLGVLLYYMLFNENPFGKDQKNILLNNIAGKYQIPSTKQDKNIIEIMKSMLQKNPQKRKSSKEYLTSKIFMPSYRSKISKHTFFSFFEYNFNQKIDEFEVGEDYNYVQSVKTLQINKGNKK
ncbi:unnamed protein product [Paramecium pentaurelia]|uniref:Protein kinase domain-containing protein n=1 Tax=Paramecium pentaurelia TaxID=43138 RepID=A0A8S1WYL4_9CILI|nr:unnamed protein product [Paramecium pentaurelia]